MTDASRSATSSPLKTGRAQCHAEVSVPPWYIDTYRCSRKAKDGPWADGVHLCWQHLKEFDKRGFVRLYNAAYLRNVEGKIEVER